MFVCMLGFFLGGGRWVRGVAIIVNVMVTLIFPRKFICSIKAIGFISCYLLNYKLFLLCLLTYLLHMSLCTCRFQRATVMCGNQRLTCSCLFSPSTMCDTGIQPRSLGVVTGTFIC